MFARLVTGFVIVALAVPALSAADKSQKVIDDFLAAVQASDQFSEDQVAETVKAVELLRKDEYDVQFAITEGLCGLYPAFAKALDVLAEEDDVTPAIKSLEKMTTSKDAFLAAEAAFFLARTFAIEEKFEEAAALLDGLVGSEKTLQVASSLYLLGATQSGLLQRKEAAKNLQQFIDDYPNAPERMRIGAERQLSFLTALKTDSITDAFERMDFSRRHLKLEKSGGSTQDQQDKVVAILDKLIKAAEKRESKSKSDKKKKEKKDCKKCEGEGCKECKGSGKSESESQGKGQKGGRSKNPDGVAKRSVYNGPQSPWDKLRDKERDPAYTAIKNKLPARYERLIEQYYKSFQDGAED